jgi:hypothetical protein
MMKYVNPSNPQVAQDWDFYIEGYKSIENGESSRCDWLQGGICLYIEDRVLAFPLHLLLMEELEVFLSWLQVIEAGGKPNAFFQFMNTELCFEHHVQEGSQSLKMVYGEVDEPLYEVNFPLDDSQMKLKEKLNHISTLVQNYPCPCNKTHTSFERYAIS